MIIKKDFLNDSFIKERFAYSFFREKVNPTGNIVSFRCATDMIVPVKKDHIISHDVVHFCWEIPNAKAFGGVVFQRHFLSFIGEFLHHLVNSEVLVEGQKLLVKDQLNSAGIVIPHGICNFSFCNQVYGATLGQIGLINGDAADESHWMPNNMIKLNLTRDQIDKLCNYVMATFYRLTEEIFIDSVGL